MRNTKGFCALVAWLRLAWVAGWLMFVLPVAAELRLPTLQTKQRTYTNVVITSKSQRDIYIKHAGGIGNVKLEDIEDDDALVALGLKAPPVKVEVIAPSTNVNETTTLATNEPPATQTQTQSQVAHYQALTSEKLKELKKYLPATTVLFVILGTFLVFYLFGCFCLKLICEKAGSEPGFLVWIPLFHVIPALRAAGMSPWWFLALGASFLPALGLPFLLQMGKATYFATAITTAVAVMGVGGLFWVIAQIIWCFKITSARGKSILVAILLLLPGLSFFAFLYLAFSSRGDE